MKILNQKFIDLIIVLTEPNFATEKSELLHFFRSELQKIETELNNLQIPEVQKTLLEFQKFNFLQIKLENQATFYLQNKITYNKPY